MTASLWSLPSGPLVALGVIALGAGFFQAAAGFGFALLAVPLMALAVPTKTAVIVVFLHGTCSSVLTAGQRPGHIEWTEAKRLSIGAIVAMPFGALVLLTASSGVLRLVLGIVVCSAATWMLLPGTKLLKSRAPRPVTTYAVGAVSGVLNTALSTNGPPLVVYLRARNLGIPAFRSTISVVFTISNVVGFVILLVSGAIHVVACKYFVLTLAPALMGWALGSTTVTKLRTEHFTRMVDLLLLVSGILAIVKALSG